MLSLMANYWASKGWQISLVTLSGRSDDCYALDPRIERVALDVMGESGNLWLAALNNWRRIKALRRAIREAGAPIVISFQDCTNVLVLLAARGTGCRVIVSERTDPRYYDIGKVWSLLRRWTYRSAEALVIQSEAVHPWASHLVSEGRCKVIANPVREIRDVPAAREEKQQAPTVVAMGRLSREKRFDMLIRAFANLAPDFPSWRLLIIGEGGERERLEHLVRELDMQVRVSLPGRVSDPERVLAASDVFVLASSFEGFPNALLEAMACGLAVISTDYPSDPRAIIDDGINGLIVPRNDQPTLTLAMRSLMGDAAARRRLGAHALGVRERFSIPRIMAQWERLIGELGVSTPKQRSIVFLTRRLDVGGAERQLIELAHGLNRLGWQVKVVTFYGGGALEADLRARGVRLESVGKRGRWDVVSFLFRLVRLLRAERVEILHSYLVAPNILAVLLKPLLSRTKIVWGVRASNMDQRAYDWLAVLTFRVSAWLSRFADLVICNSEAGRSFHAEQGYPQSRMAVIANGIDTQRFRPDMAARVAVRSEWGVSDTDILIGLVGRLDPMKDHPTFLRAAAELAQRVEGVRFACIGDGPSAYRTVLERFASELGLDGRVIWTGARLDMPRVYNALDLVACSSPWGEGFPNVVAEAMATGIPCVVTDVGDSPHIVGDTRWVCPPQDARSLAQTLINAMDRMHQNTYDRASLRQRIEGLFGVENLLQATAARLELLADRKPK